MLRQRHSQTRPWLYIFGSFIAGAIIAYVIVSGKREKNLSWQELNKQREVLSQQSLTSGHGENISTGAKKKLLAVLGVQTGFQRANAPQAYNYRMRRDALRSTWFPGSQAEADRWEEETGILYRFVIGHSESAAQEGAISQEIEENGAFLRLPIQEAYMSLTTKTLVFLQLVISQFDADYIMKVDDDVYLRTDRLPYAMAQWTQHRADYIGCMKTGTVFRDPHLRWFEPQHALIGGENYFTHAWGSIYVLSGHAAKTLALVTSAVPNGLRFFSNEDVTVGGWMLAMNVTHLDDRRLCEKECGPATLVVYDIPKCAGLCDAPKSLPILHATPECRTAAVDPKTKVLPTLQPYFWFSL